MSGEPTKGRADTEELADLLLKLKERSGFSYGELARRTFSTVSTLHRYCTGVTVPGDYALIAAMAKECGATPEELNALIEHWRAVAPNGNSCRPARSEPDPPVRAARWPPSWSRRSALALLACVVLLGVGAALLVWVHDGRGREPANTALTAGPGDQWTFAPWPVNPASFGVTINSNTGTMPSFKVGSVRFWDDGTRWADLEPHRGEFTWSGLDRLTRGARRAGIPALYTLGGTPAWAAPEGAKSLYADGSRTAPPDDLGDWDTFIRALAHRYRGRLEAYELWDTADDPHFYTGRLETLAEMVRRAARIIKSEDPRATIVCPSAGHLREPSGLAFLRRFAKLGGYEPCDVVGLKMRQRPAEEPPETMAAELAAVDRTLHAAGVGTRRWDTGPDYDVRGQQPVTGERARDYAVRFYLMSLYGRGLFLERAYFYNWGGRHIPIVLQPDGEPPTAAARAVDRLQTWLAGARIRGCGHGAAAGVPGNVWQCRFLRAGRDLTIRWASAGTATVPADPRTDTLARLDGTYVRVAPGDPIRITGSPVALTSAAN